MRIRLRKQFDLNYGTLDDLEHAEIVPPYFKTISRFKEALDTTALRTYQFAFPRCFRDSDHSIRLCPLERSRLLYYLPNKKGLRRRILRTKTKNAYFVDNCALRILAKKIPTVLVSRVFSFVRLSPDRTAYIPLFSSLRPFQSMGNQIIKVCNFDKILNTTFDIHKQQQRLMNEHLSVNFAVRQLYFALFADGRPVDPEKYQINSQKFNDQKYNSKCRTIIVTGTCTRWGDAFGTSLRLHVLSVPEYKKTLRLSMIVRCIVTQINDRTSNSTSEVLSTRIAAII